MSVYVGVDPGNSGAIAVIYAMGASDDGMVVESIKNDSTESELAAFLLNVTFRGVDHHARIERVHAMPGQGVTSMFTFGQSYGFLRGLLISSGLPFEEVQPAKWQRAMGIPAVSGETITEKKRRHKARAQQLFPQVKITLATVDALLIAEYCRRVRTGTL